MNIQDKIKENSLNEKNRIFSMPLYDEKGKPIKEKDIKKKRRNIIIAVSSALIIAIAGFVYLPQFFIHDEISNPVLVTPNPDAISLRAEYLKANPNGDIDNDGLTNQKELETGTNPYFSDTDKDGIDDKNDNIPLEKNDEIFSTLISSGISVDSAYQINGVILWADNKDSFTHGSVIETVTGYNFTDFYGWAKFPYGKYAYKYENEEYKLLQHREYENAWRIDGNIRVVLADKEQEESTVFNFFGQKTEMNNWFGKFLSVVFPDKGYITCKSTYTVKTEQTNGNNTYAQITKINYDINDIYRFGIPTNSLTELSDIYRTLTEGHSVLASLYSSERGESIVVIYGYASNGNLLVADPDNTDKKSFIEIIPASVHSEDTDKNIFENKYFNFIGCGFDSSKGDELSFFASATDDNKTDNSEQSETEIREKDDKSSEIIKKSNDNENSKTETSMNYTSKPESSKTESDSASLIQSTPENGKYELGGETYYYIDRKFVENSFIRYDGKKYIKCNASDNGAFYINEKGLKQTGKIKVGKFTYFYYNNAFFKNCFIRKNGSNYIKCEVKDKNSIYTDSNAFMKTGWFKVGNNEYYAKSDGIIQKSVFVKYTDGELRYLNDKGRIDKNCMIKVDGADVLLDKSGKIQNKDNISNVIKKHTVS